MVEGMCSFISSQHQGCTWSVPDDLFSHRSQQRSLETAVSVRRNDNEVSVVLLCVVHNAIAGLADLDRRADAFDFVAGQKGLQVFLRIRGQLLFHVGISPDADRRDRIQRRNDMHHMHVGRLACQFQCGLHRRCRGIRKVDGNNDGVSGKKCHSATFVFGENGQSLGMQLACQSAADSDRSVRQRCFTLAHL